MNRMLAAVCMGTLLLAASTSVLAQPRGDEVAAALFGAIAGAMLSQDNDDGYYYEAPPAYYGGPVYYGGQRSWRHDDRRGRGRENHAHPGGHFRGHPGGGHPRGGEGGHRQGGGHHR